MSDTTNALSGSSGANSGLINAIAHPTVVNPLAAYQGALQTAKSDYEVQQLRANKAIGDILQQSTDENGNVDYNKAQRLASQAGPVVQSGMQSMLLNASQLRREQIQNTAANMHTIGSASLSAINDQSDGNINAILDGLKARGYPSDQVERERTRWLAMSGDQRRQEAFRLAYTNLDGLAGLNRQTGGVGILDTGGAQQPYVQQSPERGGGISLAPGAVTTTMSPNVIGTQVIEWDATADDVKAGRATAPGQKVRMGGPDLQRYLGNGGIIPQGARVSTAGGSSGVVGNDGKPVSPNNPPRLLNTPGGGGGGGGGSTQPPAASGPPAPPGAPAGASSSPYMGGGIGTVLNPSGGGGQPPAAPTGGGRRSDLGGGVNVASANALAPNVGTASPPSPAVAGDVNAILTGMNQARTGQAPGTQVAGATFATGPGYEERGNAAASQDRLNADNQFAANYAANVFPQVQALSLYGRGMTTSPGSDLLNQAKGWTGGFLRSMGFSGSFDSTKEYDELHKWLSQIVTSNPYAAGSDARLAATLQGNANTGIHEQAAADMLKTGIALTRMRATADARWNAMSSQEKAQYGYYNDFLRQFNKDVDIRGFALDMMNPEQKKTLLADIKAHGGAGSAYEKKIMDTRQWATDAGYMGSERAMP